MQCLHCGTEHDPAGGGFCAACGMYVGRPVSAAAPRPAAPPPEPEPRCAECGVDTHGELRCPGCGARLQRATDQLGPDERRELARQRRARGVAAAAAPRRAAAALTLEDGAHEVDLLSAPPVPIDGAVLGRALELDLEGAPGITGEPALPGPEASGATPASITPAAATPAPAWPETSAAPPPVPPARAAPGSVLPGTNAAPPPVGPRVEPPAPPPRWDAPMDDEAFGVEFDLPGDPPGSR